MKVFHRRIIGFSLLVFSLLLSLSACKQRQGEDSSRLPSAPAGPVATPSTPMPPAGAEKPAAPLPESGRVITDLVNHLVLQPPISHQNLTVFPVVWEGEPDAAAYSTLASSTKKKTIAISELESAAVPELKLTNQNAEPLFLMTGEILAGAKQDRILAHDMIVTPDQKELAIPVYCVESGRWTEKSKHFEVANGMAPTKVRGVAQQKVNQGVVWSEVGKVNTYFKGGGSDSLQATMEKPEVKKEREAYQKALQSLPAGGSYVGIVVAINGKITNADVFSSPALFASLWPKLLDSYALEAWRLREEKPEKTAGLADAQDYLTAAFQAQYRELTNPAAGQEFMMETKAVRGTVLVYNRKVVHLALFPLDSAAPSMKEMEAPVNARPASPPPLVGATAVPPQIPNQRQELRNRPGPEQVQQLLEGPGGGMRPDTFKPDGQKFELNNQQKVKTAGP